MSWLETKRDTLRRRGSAEAAADTSVRVTARGQASGMAPRARRRANAPQKVPDTGSASASPNGARATSTCASASAATPPLDPRLTEARERVRDACKAAGIPFLDLRTPENVTEGIDEGVRIVPGDNPETARIGRAHTRRTLAV